MRLQRIASEAAQIPEPLVAVKELYLAAEKVQVVNSLTDIDHLNHILSVGLPQVQSNKFEAINIVNVEAKMKLAKAYYDPNSVHDNFI